MSWLFQIEDVEKNECVIQHEMKVIDDIKNQELIQSFKKMGQMMGIKEHKNLPIGLRRESMFQANAYLYDLFKKNINEQIKNDKSTIINDDKYQHNTIKLEIEK